ncbi:DUF1176 domain-containing protein [Vreelandella zhanjiangensis]|uniref:DUF1176 domain-containing protein n=1 Tax=Vreelandella zhanjiangensis TaxID=1121960 RepID=UPI00402A817B
MLRSLGWMAFTTMGLSISVASAQADTQRAVDEQTTAPEVIAARLSDTCVPIDEALGIVPQHYAMDDEMGGDLWLLPCNAGAYQTSYEAIYQAEDAEPRKLLFALWRNSSWTGTESLFDPEFDPETGILSDQYKDRGAGNCGGERTWQWQEGNFRLVEYRANEACEDESQPFPVVFKAE